MMNKIRPRQDFFDALNTNGLSAFYVTLALLPLLQKSKDAKVINVSSLAGSVGLVPEALKIAAAPAYFVSKSAVNMLSATLAGLLKDVTIIALHVSTFVFALTVGISI